MSEFRSFLRSSPIVLSEIGQAHEGSFEIACSLLELAKASGADGIKCQIHIAEYESTLDEEFRPGVGARDENRYEYWRRTALSLEAWGQLRQLARELDLLFIPSVFSTHTASLVEELEVDAWKIGSAEALHPWFLEHIKSMGQPIIASTGLSLWSDIENTVQTFEGFTPEFALLQCTSRYPTPLAEVGVGLMERMGAEFHIPVGLSDHSGTLSSAIYALSRGASIVEVHVTPHRGLRGFDATSSLTFEELRSLVSFRDDLLVLRGQSASKDDVSSSLEELRTIFGRSVAPVHEIKKGTVIEQSMLALKKPGGGFPHDFIPQLVGMTAARNLSPAKLIKKDDLE